MSASNPFNFIDPLRLQFPANKFITCPPAQKEPPQQRRQTYFDGIPTQRPRRWAFDNYFYLNCPFDPKRKRADRQNIELRFDAIHKAEQRKTVPVCSQSWYGHRVAATKYDQRLTTFSVGKRAELLDLRVPCGMSWPQQPRETQVFRTKYDLLKPDKI